MHNLHTFEHRLICIYTLRQQAREKTQKIGRKCATVAPYLAASSHSHSFARTSSPSPSKMERGPGGEARNAPIASIPIDNPISRLVCFISIMKVRLSSLFWTKQLGLVQEYCMPPRSITRPRQTFSWVLLILANMLWACSYVAAKVALRDTSVNMMNAL